MGEGGGVDRLGPSAGSGVSRSSMLVPWMVQFKCAKCTSQGEICKQRRHVSRDAESLRSVRIPITGQGIVSLCVLHPRPQRSITTGDKHARMATGVRPD